MQEIDKIKNSIQNEQITNIKTNILVTTLEQIENDKLNITQEEMQ